MGNPKILPGEKAVSAGQAGKSEACLSHFGPGQLSEAAYLKGAGQHRIMTDGPVS